MKRRRFALAGAAWLAAHWSTFASGSGIRLGSGPAAHCSTFAFGCGAIRLGSGPAAHGARSDEGPGRRLDLVATRFSFSPRELRAAEGERLTLAIRSTDFMHGFAIPELKLRIDTQPGKTVELVLPALRAGRYACLCDNFCGEGHDQMVATLLVGAA